MNSISRWYPAIVVVLGLAASPSWGKCARDANCDEGRVCKRGRCVVVAGEPTRSASLLSPAEPLSARLAATASASAAPAPEATPAPNAASAPDAEVIERANRARFSLVRFAVEAIGSGLAGGLAGYAAYAGICGSRPCLGGFLGGVGLNLAVVAGGTWLIGTFMGGAGDLLYTIIGALLPFSAIVVGDPGVAFGIQLAFAPLAAAVIYELTSQMKSVSMGASPIQLGVVPFSDGQRQGWTALVGFTF
jgi:hypothetical protein